MSSISKWLCRSSTKNLFVKIVHPGGHVELHDRPILAAELLNRNPKCCVAHPTVFQQPYAIVSPETTLLLGQKYYVVPLGTIRKLQLRHPPPLLGERMQDEHIVGERIDGHDAGEGSSSCWLFKSNKSKERERDGNSGCLQSMSSVIKIKSGSSGEITTGEETRTQSIRKRDDRESSAGVRNGGEAPPGRLTLVSSDNWQPGLESVVEDY